MTDVTRVDRDMLMKHITCWDEFVTQASDAAIKTYGVEYNNWALYIPALMAELNNSIAHDINTRVYDEKQLELGLEPQEPEIESDDATELSVGTRLNQLKNMRASTPPGPAKHRVMDPFRRLDQDKQFDHKPDERPDPWADDPDWNE